MTWGQNFQRATETQAGRMTTEPDDRAGMRFLTLGGKAPEAPGELFSDDPDTPYAAILLMRRVEAGVVAAALAQAPDPAAPIADFGDNPMLRRDFSRANFDPGTFAEMKEAFEPIWRRLVELPWKAEREDRAELMTLRIAYSRNAPIEADLTPETRNIVEYPLLGVNAGDRRQLELLAESGLLRRRHFMRTHACGKCGSARLNVFEACPSCDSSDLMEEEIVHHYRCGAQAGQSRFAQGELLVCPKCRRILRHFGTDYDKPGVLITCLSCGASNSHPVVRFVCLDCKAFMASEDAATIDWRHYDLTDEGVRALREGRLPRFEIGAALDQRTRTHSPHEFRMLVMRELRVALRYKRPFSVAQLSFSNLDALRHEKGSMAVGAAFLVAVDAVIGALRSSDFVGVRSATSAMIAFPETSAADVRDGVVARMRKTIRETTDIPIELSIDIAEGEAIASTLVE
jgi:hypothetical protein